MEHKSLAKSHDYLTLWRVSYNWNRGFPDDPNEQRKLAEMAFRGVKVAGGATSVEQADIKNVYHVARALYEKAIKEMAKLSPEEKQVLKTLSIAEKRGPLDADLQFRLEERIARILEDCDAVAPGVAAAIEKYGGYELRRPDASFDPATLS